MRDVTSPVFPEHGLDMGDFRIEPGKVLPKTGEELKQRGVSAICDIEYHVNGRIRRKIQIIEFGPFQQIFTGCSHG